MTITKKYNIKMLCDQAGDRVPEDFLDASELPCIEKFEECCLDLKSQNRERYTMIELGSNQAYYSMLFRGIIDSDKKNQKCKNIMLEPTPEHMKRGKRHFFHNNFEGIFEEGGIGHYWCWHTRWHEKSLPSYTIDELMKKHYIDQLDVLHSDIDGNEIRLLESSERAFKDKKINYIFILTHGVWNELESTYSTKIIKNGENRHKVCREFLLNCGYSLLLDVSENVGYDGLLVFKA
jgi:hypothetical protein